MAKCTWSGCTDKALEGKKLCNKHRLAQQKEEQLKRQKEQMQKAQKEREELQKQMAAEALKKQQTLEKKEKKIKTIVTDWNQKVAGIVTAVKDLRKTLPTANAGNNANGNTLGGNTNPLKLSLPTDAKGITKGEVFPRLTGFDKSGSDSAKCKIRIKDPGKGDILVHIE